MRTALLLVAVLAAGCVTRTKEANPPVAEAPPGIVIQCETARVVLPAGEVAKFGADGSLACGAVTMQCPKPVVETGGEDFSVVAEGEVRIHRTEGGRTFSEGPYRLAVYRNGQLLTR